MDEKTMKFNLLFKQTSFKQFFGARGEIEILLGVLNEEEVDKLLEINSIFVRSCAPSSKIDLNGLNINGRLTLINFDSNYYKHLLPEEFVGVLLHEIGHVLNPDKKGMDGEYAADDFSACKGFAKWVISGLEKGKNRGWMGFEESSCNSRIEKLKKLKT